MNKDKTSLPRVAVIISNFNYGEFILEAIESAIAQDYPNLEIVIVDDCSTDDSVQKIADRFEFFIKDFHELADDPDKTTYTAGYQDGPDVTLIVLKENGKQGRSRNFGIRECWDRAEYFLILDGDDTIMPNKVSRFVEKFLEDEDSIGSVHADYYILNTSDGTITKEFKSPYSKELLHRDCHLHSGGMISKLAFERVGLFDTDVCPKEDYLMWLKISEYFMCCHIADFLSVVRVSPKNTTDSLSQEFHNKQYNLMSKRFQEFLENKNK